MANLNETPTSERVHISIFGRRNAGKSALINAITGQNLSIVSDIAGTTTDPVYKTMELLPIGPVVLIDTPGIDDDGALGELRVIKTHEVLNKSDIALIVVDSSIGLNDDDNRLIKEFQKRNIPYIVVFNKIDISKKAWSREDGKNFDGAISIFVSATDSTNILELKNKIGIIAQRNIKTQPLLEDLISFGDIVIFVIPIDKAAPKGRLILPEQQAIRAVLDANAISLVIRESEISKIFGETLREPALVVTDSQAFAEVAKYTPSNIRLTSFSMLFARYKGILDIAVKGVTAIDSLSDHDTVLISEGCTHHRQCDDIGTVKLPKLLLHYTQKKLKFEWSTGREYPSDLSNYTMVIHCGGCMLNDAEVLSRYNLTSQANVPITNYGIAIAHMNGILSRTLSAFNVSKLN